MERQVVESTHLKSIGYDSIYQYFQVPADVYAGLVNAESQGQYFDKYIKKKSFIHLKIG